MSDPIQFSSHLHDLMSLRRMDVDELTHEMGFTSNTVVVSWRNGWTRPEPEQLPKLARVLAADPVNLALGWLVDRVPELEGAIFAEVLTPRGATFPRSDDLALRAPKRRPSVGSMDVDDPHDVERPVRDHADPDRVVRKKALRR